MGVSVEPHFTSLDAFPNTFSAKLCILIGVIFTAFHRYFVVALLFTSTVNIYGHVGTVS